MRGKHRGGEASGEGVAAGETEGRAEEGEDFSGDEPVGDEGVGCGEQEDPEGRGIAGDDAAVEGEATAGGEAAGELEMDECVVLPVVPGVHEPVEAPEEGESEEECGGDAGLRGRARLGGHRLGLIIKRRESQPVSGGCRWGRFCRWGICWGDGP